VRTKPSENFKKMSPCTLEAEEIEDHKPADDKKILQESDLKRHSERNADVARKNPDLKKKPHTSLGTSSNQRSDQDLKKNPQQLESSKKKMHPRLRFHPQTRSKGCTKPLHLRSRLRRWIRENTTSLEGAAA
jgi:hypothetical protein